MDLDTTILLGALAIFALRVVAVTISTVRMLILVQGRRFLSTVMGFFESLLFAVALGGVVTQLDNVWNLMAYSLGFATGTYLGMVLEARVVTNFLTVNIISPKHAHKIAEAIRAAGFGATEMIGVGADGMVGSVRAVVRRSESRQVLDVVNRIDGDAFVTLDETRAIRHGWLRAGRG